MSTSPHSLVIDVQLKVKRRRRRRWLLLSRDFYENLTMETPFGKIFGWKGGHFCD